MMLIVHNIFCATKKLALLHEILTCKFARV